MANITKSLAYTLANEGGYVDNPLDRGGPTNKGITLKLYSQYCGKLMAPRDLQNISDEDVLGVYNRFFWSLLDLNQVADDNVATALFDIAVNMGPHESCLLAQTALSWMPTWAQMQKDGIMGSWTLNALNKTDPDTFITFFENAVDKHYRDICSKDITQVAFLGGWIKRAQRLLTLKVTTNGPA
jgi:lysozyme family protein